MLFRSNRVGAAASTIETRLRADDTEIGGELTELGAALAELNASVGEIVALGAPSGEGESLAADAIEALLTQLEAEIAENNPGAGDTAQELIAGIGTDSAAAEPLAAICEALDMFDFPTATERLAELRSSIG